MSWEQRVGQLLCSGVGEKRETVERLIAQGHLGGLILYTKDLPDPAGAAALTNHFQRLAPVPLLLSADFEAGVGRLVRGATALPSNMALGAAGEEELARLGGRITAVEARALGIHLIYAPVVDVNVNPANPIINIRSFGGDPEEVSHLAVAWIEACQAHGGLATAKHFPGHGDTAVDSHRALPTVPHGRERMERVELRPFRAAIEAGVTAIMTAHIHFPAIDPTPGLPATLSEKILTGLLRREMGFRGLIVTDALGMWAIKHNFDPADAVVRAVQAGCDFLLVDDPELSHTALTEAVREGRVSEERLRDAGLRVLQAKEQLGLVDRALVDEAAVRERVGTEEHLQAALRLARAAVTLLRGEENLEALRRKAKLLALTPPRTRYTGESSSERWLEALQTKFPHLEALPLEEQLPDEQMTAAVQRAGKCEAAIFAVFAEPKAYDESGVRVEEKQADLVAQLASRVPTVVVALGSPYTLPRFPAAHVWLCTYSECDASLQAAAEVLAGEVTPSGQLPVALSEER